jgi:S-adenosylmethionine hydrolase
MYILFVFFTQLLQFGALAANIRGEESNKFTNTLGETIAVQVEANESATAALLCKYFSHVLTRVTMR